MEENNSNFLAKGAEWVGEVFEKLSPSLFRFLAAFLPYLSPVPVSVVTAKSAGEFLDFDTTVAFVLVFVLGGIGLWFTSLLVDAVVDYIQAGNYRDWKSLSVVLLFVLAILGYIGIEIGLNVSIHTEDSSPQRQVVLFLLSMLPLITGIGNGYYKLKLQQNAESKAEKKRLDELEEQRHQEAREDRLKNKMIKNGMNPMEAKKVAYQADTVSIPPVQETKKALPKDWRLLNLEQKRKVRYSMTPKEIMEASGVSRATAYNWKYDESKYPV